MPPMQALARKNASLMYEYSEPYVYVYNLINATTSSETMSKVRAKI